MENPYNPLSADDFDRLKEPTGQDLYEQIQAFNTDSFGFNKSEPQQFASKYLNEIGIPGIKYYDGMSRSAGEGTRNYVVFDDTLPKILKRNGGLLE